MAVVFERDRLTVLIYGMAVSFGYAMAALGPAMPLLREDLAINRTVGGLHFAAIAAGSVVAGFVVDASVRRFGRHAIFWSGAGGIAAGSLLIGVAPGAAVSLSGSVIMGIAGSAMLAVSQATLSDHHASNRPQVLAEVYTATSVGTVLPALAIGLFVGIGASWRPALFVPTLIVVFLAVRRRSESFPARRFDPGQTERIRLPRAYWLFWLALVPAVGAEWSIGAWGADYMVSVANAPVDLASILMTCFFGSIVIGRFVGSRFVRRLGPLQMVAGSAALGLTGGVLIWRSGELSVIAVGLLLSGLGISVLFPMIVTLAVGTAPESADAATARFSIAAGGATLTAPLLLGVLADDVGIQSAFALVPALLVGVVVLVVLGRLAA